ncbi:nuclear transport factor 2 family protein [Marinicella meishanensis]|uniref:nuclear transport factor 2 family protein n=1 Tax=Marinicella meishanensis TaxID=2873263 RepID=UPI001CC1532B|nr:nuclear transport factor 2 family protein [Marinicella sp. NBU2979]
MKHAFLGWLMITSSSAFGADHQPSLAALATQYMQAYSAWDIPAMSQLQHANIHFNDPTATDAFGRSFSHRGKAEVATFLSGIFGENKPQHLTFKVKEQFVSGNHVVIHATFESVLPDAWYGERATGPVLVSIPITTVLVFADQQIISHTDYADYASYQQQINWQLAPAKNTNEKP